MPRAAAFLAAYVGVLLLDILLYIVVPADTAVGTVVPSLIRWLRTLGAGVPAPLIALPLSFLLVGAGLIIFGLVSGPGPGAGGLLLGLAFSTLLRVWLGTTPTRVLLSSNVILTLLLVVPAIGLAAAAHLTGRDVVMRMPKNRKLRCQRCGTTVGVNGVCPRCGWVSEDTLSW